MELSKKEKKIARGLIEDGFQKEFAKGLFEMDAIIEGWKNKSTDSRDAYHALYRQITMFDKRITRRYDGMRGSDYLFILAAQLKEGFISEEQLNDFTPGLKDAIIRISRI